MASREIMQDYVSRQYGGSWPQKVAKMSDEQVAAIYHKMLIASGRLKNDALDIHGGEQLSLFKEGETVHEWNRKAARKDRAANDEMQADR